MTVYVLAALPPGYKSLNFSGIQEEFVIPYDKMGLVQSLKVSYCTLGVHMFKSFPSHRKLHEIQVVGCKLAPEFVAELPRYTSGVGISADQMEDMRHLPPTLSPSFFVNTANCVDYELTADQMSCLPAQVKSFGIQLQGLLGEALRVIPNTITWLKLDGGGEACFTEELAAACPKTLNVLECRHAMLTRKAVEAIPLEIKHVVFGKCKLKGEGDLDEAIADIPNRARIRLIS